MQKMLFNQFPIIGLWKFMETKNNRKVGVILIILNCPYPSNICTKLGSYSASVALEELSLKDIVAMATKQNGRWS